jgi:hypothetical protein
MAYTSDRVITVRSIQIKPDALVFVGGPPPEPLPPLDSLMSYADLFVEWRTRHTTDAWAYQDRFIAQKANKEGEAAFGQSIDCATAVFIAAPRTHCFSLTFFRDQVRIFPRLKVSLF